MTRRREERGGGPQHNNNGLQSNQSNTEKPTATHSNSQQLTANHSNHPTAYHGSNSNTAMLVESLKGSRSTFFFGGELNHLWTASTSLEARLSSFGTERLISKCLLLVVITSSPHVGRYAPFPLCSFLHPFAFLCCLCCTCPQHILL